LVETVARALACVLNLDDGPGALATGDNVISAPGQTCPDGVCQHNDDQGVKALSGKSQASVLKMVQEPRTDRNEPTVISLVKEFDEILSPARYELVN
jgi:hypothetical protein